MIKTVILFGVLFTTMVAWTNNIDNNVSKQDNSTSRLEYLVQDNKPISINLPVVSTMQFAPTYIVRRPHKKVQKHIVIEHNSVCHVMGVRSLEETRSVKSFECT